MQIQKYITVITIKEVITLMTKDVVSEIIFSLKFKHLGRNSR